jgi:magnesium chelatase accessory protein
VTPSPDPDRLGPFGPHPEANRSVEAGGVHWHLRRLGSGPPLLLLHGTASSGQAWAEVASRVRSDFSLVIPDLPGHGHSSGLPAALVRERRRPDSGHQGPDDMARALGALLRAEAVEPALVAGHSVGAVLAIRAASRGWIAPAGILGVNPALGARRDYLPRVFEGPAALLAGRGPGGSSISKGVSLGAAALFRRTPLAELFLRSTGSRITHDMERHYRALLADPERVRGVLRLQDSWDAEGAGREAAELGRRDPPTTVRFVAGDRDRWVPLATIRREAAGLPVEVVAARGHLLPEEDPGAVADAIRRLAREVGVGGPELDGIRPHGAAPGPP